jgi:hypothetical protein|tara:strand:- start:2644 stop:2805 length:162 start_codon:yes stop_codon:yes gene_type:complete
LTSSLDIYRTANLLIQQHGDEAAIQAAMKAGYEFLHPAAQGGGWRSIIIGQNP